MAAYVIADTLPVDDELFAKYRPLAAESIARYGGRYVARGGAIDAVEGGWDPEFLIIVEFPSIDRAREWYSSGTPHPNTPKHFNTGEDSTAA